MLLAVAAVTVLATACATGASSADGAGAVPSSSAPGVGTSAVAAPGPPRVAVVGDSTAERLAPAVEAWAGRSSDVVYVGNASRLGCPMGRGGSMHTAADVTGPVNADCDWETAAVQGVDGTERPTFSDVATTWDPDLVLVSNGIWDVADRQRPGEADWSHAGDPAYDAWLLEELIAATDELRAGGATVVWLTLSPWEGATRHPPERLYAPAADPARVVAYNRLLEQVVAARPGSAAVIDLASWLDETGEDARLRPDGAHLEPDTASEVIDRFLGAALLEAWASIASR